MKCMRFVKIALAAMVWVPSMVWAGDAFKTEYALTLDGTVNVVVAHPWRDVSDDLGVGGNVGFEVRPVKLLSVGLQYNERYFPGTDWKVGAVDVDAKLFPLGRTQTGEAYIGGGVGRIVPKNNDVDDAGKRVHGTLSAGYRFFFEKHPAFFADLGAVYDAYSPRKAPLSLLGVQAGLGWRFGGSNSKTETDKPAAAGKKDAPSATEKKNAKQAGELSQVAEVKNTAEGILVSLKGDILFSKGKADLSAEAKDRVAKLGAVLAKYPGDTVVVTGYTDSTGSVSVNQKLSEARAKAVREALLSSQVPASSVTAVGKGSADPMGDNRTAEGRAKNRRVEIKINNAK